jgi:hypothetical protein
MHTTNRPADASLAIAFCCCFIFFILHIALPYDAHAENRLLLLYSGNVNGEIEGCG